MRQNRKPWVIAVLAAGMMLLTAAPSRAQFEVQITVPGATAAQDTGTAGNPSLTVVNIGTGSNPIGQVTITDGGAGDDSSITDRINFSVSFQTSGPQQIVLTGNAATTNLPNSSPPGANAKVDLQYSVDSTPSGTGASPITLAASAAGFVAPPGPSGTLISTIGGTNDASESITAEQIENNSNTLFPTSGNSITQGPFTGPAYSGTQTLSFALATPFSITEILTVSNLGSNESITGDFSSQLSGAPSPSSLFLGAVGMPLLGIVELLRRRRRMGKAVGCVSC